MRTALLLRQRCATLTPRSSTLAQVHSSLLLLLQLPPLLGRVTAGKQLQKMRFATLAALATAYQAPPRTCPAVLRAPPLRATAATGDVPATVTTLWRYPIKGFPPDSLASVSLKENGTFPQLSLIHI